MRDITLTNGGKRRAILAVFVAVALLGAAFALFFAPAANAARSDTDWVTVGETVLARSSDGTTKFNKNSLEALYGYLTAEGTYSSVAAAAQSGKTSADFRTLNGGKNVSVYFGGFEWDVVYLTTAQNGGGNTNKGDVILDLWRSVDDNMTYAKDAVIHFNAPMSNTTVRYPSMLYSVYYSRVVGLNIGGAYNSTSRGSSLDYVNQDANHQYARFTMTEDQGVSGSLTQFIATPVQVGYQEHEWDEATSNAINSNKYYCPNDAYGVPEVGGQWIRNEFNLLERGDDEERPAVAKYDAWKNDYLWLASISETGFEDDVGNGIWDTDVSLRSSIELKSSRLSTKITLLRSHKGDTRSGGYFSTLDESGNQGTLTGTSNGVVRPALHLNLTQANDNSEEPSLSYTFELPDSVEFAVQDGVATATINVTASDIYVPAGKTLTLYVKDNEGLLENTFYLWNGGTKKEYTLSASGGNAVENGAFDPLYGKMIWQLSNDKTIASETFTITLTLVSSPTRAGTWQDALTFTAVVT